MMFKFNPVLVAKLNELKWKRLHNIPDATASTFWSPKPLRFHTVAPGCEATRRRTNSTSETHSCIYDVSLYLPMLCSVMLSSKIVDVDLINFIISM